MSEGIKEKHFEDHLVRYLTKIAQPEFPDYQELTSEAFDKDLCLIPDDLVNFIKTSQTKKYEALQKQFGAETDEKIVYYAAQHLKNHPHKTLGYFRTKLKIYGQHLDTVYFKPQHSKTPEHIKGYGKNILTAVRQLKYSKKNENAVDIVLFLNGMPVVTMELKNALTGQYLHHAIKQYIEDRDPKEPLFEFKRCLVHFAVSTEQVSMCTQLKGKATRFLPFNKALVNVEKDDFATAYLWKDVLHKDSLLDLVQNYANIQVNKEKYYDAKTKALREKESTLLIFPRFHQRRAVQNMLHAISQDGIGHKYLVYHSAGSGKSNTISWLAHGFPISTNTPTTKKHCSAA